MFWIICAVTIVAGLWSGFNKEAARQQAVQTAVQAERERKLFPIDEELNALYYQLDILQHLEDVERIDPYRATDPKYIKKGLATEKVIQTTLKRIRTLEDKKSRL